MIAPPRRKLRFQAVTSAFGGQRARHGWGRRLDFGYAGVIMEYVRRAEAAQLVRDRAGTGCRTR